jgi:transposase-like protein
MDKYPNSSYQNKRTVIVVDQAPIYLSDYMQAQLEGWEHRKSS